MDEQGGKSENPWFTDDPIAEAPLKLIITLSSCKNRLRQVSKLFKSHAEEGTKKITWKRPDEEGEEEEEEDKPSSLMLILASPLRNRDGCFKERLPNLKSIGCDGLDILKDLNGCPSGLEELSCGQCPLIKSLAPVAACTNLRKLSLLSTRVSSLKPLMGCVKLEWLFIGGTSVTDLSPLSACINLKALWIGNTSVSDLSPLSGLHQLRLIDVETTSVSDLSPLSSLGHLETLICGSTEISDLNPLSKCSELKALNIYDTEVKSLTPLLQCKKLKYLHLDDKFKGEDTTEDTFDTFRRIYCLIYCILMISIFSGIPCRPR